MTKEDIKQWTAIIIVLASLLTVSSMVTNKAMREYDNRYNTCYSISVDAKLAIESYDEFMIDCLQSGN